MTHARKQIRDAAVAVLTGATAAGSAVYAGQLHPTTETPRLLVWTRGDAFDEYVSTESGDYARDVVLVVDAIASGLVSTLVDAVDALALEVENLIESDLTLGGVAITATYAGTDVEFDGDANPPAGRASIVYNVKFYP